MRAFPCLSVSRIRVAISRTFCFSKTLAWEPIQEIMVSPMSRMKQSPLLKLAQVSSTSLARIFRLPLIWYNLWTGPEPHGVLRNPDSTPPSL
uniref:Uncharacterized protein n=1 Tax=Anguilla anguilla TaxID=7936 RepID=A0A0E9WRM2_ANGAN